jgi:UDP-3-O-[3-hydroxymyristoyl] glucosamine N-acyltransferase
MYTYNQAKTSVTTTSIGNNARIYGDVYCDANLSLTSGVIISGDAETKGSISLGGGTITGTSEPYTAAPASPPSIETAYYNGFITTALASTAANAVYSNVTLSGKYFVHGNVTFGKSVNVSGSAEIIATGTVTVNSNATIGNNLTVIASREITIENNDVIGGNGLWYSGTSITAGNSALGLVVVGQGTTFLTPGNVTIGNTCSFSGLIFSEGTVSIGNSCNLTGSIVASSVSSIGNNSVITYNPNLVDIDIIHGVSGGELGGEIQVSWQEVY